MTNKLTKLISGALAVVMLLGFCPVFETEVQAASEEKKPVIHLYADSDNDKQAVEEKAGTSLLPLNTGTNTTQKFTVGAWHHSSEDKTKGWWSFVDPGLNPVYDSQFEQTAGNVGNVDQVIKVGTQKFNYFVQKGTPLYEALNNGEDVYINIKPNQEIAKEYNNDLKVSLSKMFAVDTVTDKRGNIVLATNSNNELDKITCKPEKVANGYNLVFSLPLKLNYHDYTNLGFNSTYGLNLRTTIPIPKNGYGEVLFSMWDPVDKPEIGTSRMWVDEKHPLSLKGMPEGRVHPTMIRPYNLPDAWGQNAGTYNDGGLLYKKVPVRTKDPVTGKTILTEQELPVNIRVAQKGHKDYGNDIKYKTTDWNIGQGTLNRGGAVGIYFHYDLAFDFYVKPQVKVVASYVELTDLTEVGSSDVYIAQYKTLCESELLSVPVHDNIVSIPLGTVMT